MRDSASDRLAREDTDSMKLLRRIWDVSGWRGALGFGTTVVGLIVMIAGVASSNSVTWWVGLVIVLFGFLINYSLVLGKGLARQEAISGLLSAADLPNEGWKARTRVRRRGVGPIRTEEGDRARNAGLVIAERALWTGRSKRRFEQFVFLRLWQCTSADDARTLHATVTDLVTKKIPVGAAISTPPDLSHLAAPYAGVSTGIDFTLTRTRQPLRHRYVYATAGAALVAVCTVAPDDGLPWQDTRRLVEWQLARVHTSASPAVSPGE